MLLVGFGRILIVTLLFFTSALAGCSSDDADVPEDPVEPLFHENGMRIGPGPVGSDPGETPDCTGCLTFERPDTDREPSTRTAAVTIPFPRAGDQVNVQGETGADLPIDPWLPASHDGRYGFMLEVDAADVKTALFQIQPHGPVHKERPVDQDLTSFRYEVSLDSRLVLNGTISGTSVVEEGHTHARHATQVDIQPETETLFWLGSHLWGRTLQNGDRFSTQWTVANTRETLRFDYHVVAAHPDGLATRDAPHHDPAGSASTLDENAQVLVRLTIRDHLDREGHWSFRFADTSPYPLTATSDAAELGPRPPDIPAMAAHQNARLIQRGYMPLYWPATVLRGHPVAPDDDATFRLGERLAPRALDTLPRYPLSTALSDLATFTSSYPEFVQQQPRRVLVQADHHVETVATGLERHTWTVVFTARDHALHSWTTTRLGDPAAHLLVPERQTQNPWDEGRGVVGLLAREGDAHTALASGDALTEALIGLGVTEIDHLHYRLEQRGIDGIGATLEVGADRLPLRLGDPKVLGFVVEDLGTQRLVMIGKIDS